MTAHPQTCDYFLVRHAPTEKPAGVVPPADPSIKNQPYALDRLTRILPVNADWYVSPLLRTRQTADLLSPTLSPNGMAFVPDLVETDFGEWHGQPIAKIWPEIAAGPLHNWTFMTADRQPPGGERFSDQVNRVEAWMRQQQTSFSPTPKVVVAHAGVLRAAMAVALEAAHDQVVGVPIPHFGVLRLTLMDPAKATAAGGCWQFASLSDPQVVTQKVDPSPS